MAAMLTMAQAVSKEDTTGTDFWVQRVPQPHGLFKDCPLLAEVRKRARHATISASLQFCDSTRK